MATQQKSAKKRAAISPTVQWVALTGIFLLVVLAIFVFEIGGAGSGGGGHSN